MQWKPIDDLAEDTIVLLYAPYEPHYCVGSYKNKEWIEQEIISDTPKRTTYRKVKRVEREWEAENWGATHYCELPQPPADGE